MNKVNIFSDSQKRNLTPNDFCADIDRLIKDYRKSRKQITNMWPWFMIKVKLHCSNAKENWMMLDELNTLLKKEILDHKIENSTF